MNRTAPFVSITWAAAPSGRSVLCRFFLAGLLFVANALATEPQSAATQSTARSVPLYFSSPEAAVKEANQLLAARDWPTLTRAYDLSATPNIDSASLLDGHFFLDTAASATGPAAVSRWRQPFPPGSVLATAAPAGDPSRLPCIWKITTLLSVPQGGGPVQKVTSTFHLIQTQAGFQFLPPAPTEGPNMPSPRPAMDDEWNARGAEPILFFRPDLKARADRELPPARLSNVPALAEAIARLKPVAQANPGTTHPGEKPWEPAMVYQPSNDELLLSLAGDRVWRVLQLAPPGSLEELHANHPEFGVETLEYPHIEIVRIPVAGVGSRFYALPPTSRTVRLKHKMQ